MDVSVKVRWTLFSVGLVERVAFELVEMVSVELVPLTCVEILCFNELVVFR